MVCKKGDGNFETVMEKKKLDECLGKPHALVNAKESE